MKKPFVALVFGFIWPATYATGENLERCLYNNGKPMEQRICDILRKNAAKKSAENDRYNERAAVQRARDTEQKAFAEAKQQELQRERDARFAELRAKEQERAKESEAMALKAQREQIQWEKSTARAASERTAKQKSLCGDDYRSPRVGMTLTRAKECVADFKLKGQINRADGVVSTYMAGQTYLHVMDGKIVSWGK